MSALVSRPASFLRPWSARGCQRPAQASLWSRRRAVHVEAHLEAIGVKLPKAIVPPQGSYVVAYQTGKLLYVSGHIPMTPEGVLLTGTVGDTINEEDAAAAARLVALNMLATLKYKLGDLDRVTRIVKLNGFVQCVDGYTGQPKVIDGASDLLAEVNLVTYDGKPIMAFGKKGVHARSAVGTSSLPLDMPVELEAIVEVH